MLYSFQTELSEIFNARINISFTALCNLHFALDLLNCSICKHLILAYDMYNTLLF